ncbi:WD repeat-containing protein 53 [Acanthopagrus latus]|uniref:WD repeat-containing protein 53 n=1 Tax=Acanthopagrus latus TaxID=8177 RepID=UPI00187C0CA0|nr:WD repeat-containing protein 53 [Acanthopagrus latus]XP_036977368.1 WD repeat-containing protein 53 [Acanthopagrus latus]XP_036977376.1 WD repeat-containing protein 53 [Acanthopagrus latus]XP_036977385.1 WD repeat-containing protein 53 [Acanthopagrus latus]
MAKQWSEGHSTAILCVGASSGPEGLLASGSEGGEVTVWSQEGTIVGRLTLPGEEDSTGVVFSPAAPSQLYVSHGDTVSVLDPRNLKGPVEEFQGAGEEEINALALNETGSSLAVADDSGAVRVLELPGGKVFRTLRRHTNICSSVAFRPHRPNNLLSAGLDMQVMLWGLQKTRPLWTLNLQDVAEEEGDHQQRPGQLFNPPLVHCVSVASCGNILGCAAEDGRVHLMRIGSGSKLEQQGAVKAHSQGASQAHFVNFLPHPYWLVTGGNDGQVALWDLSKHPVITPEAKAKTRVTAAPRRKGKSKAKRKEQSQDKAKSPPKAEAEKEEGEDEVAAGSEEVMEEKSGPKLSIGHGDKVNWLCPAVLKGEPSVVVADQSSSLTVYPLTQL